VLVVLGVLVVCVNVPKRIRMLMVYAR
jgi:hypothetical protein